MYWTTFMFPWAAPSSSVPVLVKLQIHRTLQDKFHTKSNQYFNRCLIRLAFLVFLFFSPHHENGLGGRVNNLDNHVCWKLWWDLAHKKKYIFFFSVINNILEKWKTIIDANLANLLTHCHQLKPATKHHIAFHSLSSSWDGQRIGRVKGIELVGKTI